MEGTTYDPFHGPKADKRRKTKAGRRGLWSYAGLLWTRRARDRSLTTMDFREESGCGLTVNRPRKA